MEKLLRPDRFEGSQDMTPAEWEHWYSTFTKFLDCVGNDPPPDKLKLLVDHISPSVYSHISDCQNYTDAIEVLKTKYVKSTNEIFARHQLATRKQVSGESVDQFLHSLKLLSKDCGFKDVSSATYTQESIRDAFITGLESPMIRQCLLEKDSLTLDEAVQLARNLGSVQRNAETYETPTTSGNFSAASKHSALTVRDEGDSEVMIVEEHSAAASKSVCYFCAYPYHSYLRCPARNIICCKCGKKGHFSKCCKAQKATDAEDEVAVVTIVASGVPDPPHRTTMNMECVGVLSGAGLSLPVEVLEVVLSQLPHSFLVTTCARVCRLWHEVIHNPAFLPWKKLYHQYKLAPSNPTSSLLLCKGGNDGSNDDHDGGGGGGGAAAALTAEQLVKRLCNRHDITSTSNCLVNIISAVGRIHSAPQGTSPTLVQGHRLYQLAQDTLAHLSPSLLPQPHTLWHLAATIALLSHDVWDIHALILLMLRPGSLFSPCVVVEAFYSIAVFLFHATSSSHICLPMRYHYQVFYALYLYENDWGPLLQDEVQVRREHHAGQQSMAQYIQRKSTIQYTHEQLRIINHPLEMDHVVKIVAFAGTGKTTTLLQLCKKRPDQKFLLVVFNKSVQEYCSQTFPKNTDVKTAHSMAFAAVGRRYQAIRKFSMDLTAGDITRFLPSREGTGNRPRRVGLVKKALARFLNSADEHLTLQHTPTVDNQGEAIEDDFRLQVILADAEAVWAEMTKCSKHQELNMTQDGQLKVWQLRRPRLTDYNVVMIDEGQDMNPSMLDIFLRQTCAKVIVGDPYQQIYSFRGAINALESVESTHTFYLTQSFRFGPEVSYMAQCVLDLHSERQRQTLVGGHKRDIIVASKSSSEALKPSSSRRTAFLGRSNLEVYKEALYMCQQDAFASKSMAFAGGLQKYGLDTVMDIFNLSRVEAKQGTAKSLGIKNKLIAKFESVRALKNYLVNLDDQEMYNKILMYEYSRSNTPNHIQMLKNRCSSSHNVADITFSTIHKAKGLEWDHVVLLSGSTLTELLSNINDRRQVKGLRDEINTLYVSVTRAKRFLTLNSVMMQVLRLCREKREVLVAGSEVEQGMQCLHCTKILDEKQPVVTKVMGVCVTGSGFLQGGYLCHTCSSNPHRHISPNSAALVKLLHPHGDQDFSSCARLMLVSGQP